ncbi:MAG: TrpR-related protein YerC/YecD [Oscillospiraceae bacterium]|nr:TrpR-related protein YerC/YecD [Oscillospiraceae bacterium]
MTKEEKIQHLYQTILNLESEEACAAFFEDLCTNKEVEQMAERAYAARLLMEGKTYSQIIAQADISSATLSRVSRCVQYGKGYSSVLKMK